MKLSNKFKLDSDLRTMIVNVHRCRHRVRKDGRGNYCRVKLQKIIINISFGINLKLFFKLKFKKKI